MNTSSPTSRTRLLGCLLGALPTLACAVASAAIAHRLVNVQVTSSDDVILMTVDVLAALFLARLCVICALATLDVWQSQTDGELFSRAAVEPKSQLFGRSRFRLGLAKWLLATATLLTPATASATPVVSSSISVTIPQASNDDPYLTLESGQNVAVAQQEPSRWSDDVLKTDCPTVPDPDWTLPLGSPKLGCRILGGGAPLPSHSPRTHVVQRGETVWGIAASYLPRSAGNAQIASAVNAWIKANPLTLSHPDLIQVGDTLTIPTV